MDLASKAGAGPVVGGLVMKQLWGRSTFRAFFRDLMLSDRSTLFPLEKIDRYYEGFNDPASRGSAYATLRATLDPRAVAAQTVRVTVPTLVVWGRKDRIFPARLGQRLARQIRGAGFELMDAGHAPHEERTKEFSAIAAKFLRAER